MQAPHDEQPNRAVASTPHDAASVILLRENRGRPEALLVRRHRDLAFAGGAWVFPGGKLESADYSPAALARTRPANLHISSVRDAAEEGLATEQRTGLLVAACRETFEETGLLLARRVDGAACSTGDVAAFERIRGEVSHDPAKFSTLLKERDLFIDAPSLAYWARWVTPSVVPKRFDARFYIAIAPEDQEIQCDNAEATELRWLDLTSFDIATGQALGLHVPTLFSLAALAARVATHETLHSLVTAAATWRVSPMMVKITRADGKVTAIMPWDPEYSSLPGEGTPEYSQISKLYRSFPSRLYTPEPERR